MKPSLLFALISTLACSSCQNFRLPWQQAAAPVNADPYATAATGAAGQYQAYPGTGNYPQAAPNQNYAYPNYNTSGEQAQVYPANSAPPVQDDWSNGGASASPAPRKTAAAIPKGGTYVVKRGDTLSSIGRNNGTTVSKLMSVNGLKSTTIRDGQTLRLR